VVALSGSALPAGLAERFMDEFGDVVYSLYGSTEVGTVAIATPRDLRAAPGTAGSAAPGIEIRILDESGVDVPAGEPGTIYVRSDLQFDGYTDGRTKPIIDGDMSSGDVGHLDADGRLFVDGRDDDMIVSGGENVFPAEVERVIAAMSGVHEVAVIGVPDAEFGARLAAFVVRSDPELSDTLIRDRVRHELARYKVPRDVTFVDALPRNATGKVVRAELPTG
jgi:acyl-coenzyme A synthetase/AMP-(fatty) acid ligase